MLDATPADRPSADLAALPGREAAIERLQAALRGEHALIVQIMSHAYRLRDLETLHELEGIARQDMRHFKWLAETVVRLGGTPTLERDPVFVEAAAPHVWLAADVALIESRLAAYHEHLDGMPADAGEGPVRELRDLLQRIIDDKTAHRAQVMGVLAAWSERHGGDEPGHDRLEAPAEGGEDPAPADEATRGFLEFAIGHEYEVILQYLHHGFLLEDQWAARVLEDVAIEEMRHLGWLSETLIDRGGTPYWEARRLELHDDAVRMLELDQAREIEVEADYQQMTAAMTDPAIRRLFDRIGQHERFHAGTIGRLIARLKAQRPATPALPVMPPPLPPTPAAETPGRPAKCPFTVGSLFGSAQS